jgi:hypothetical protein
MCNHPPQCEDPSLPPALSISIKTIYCLLSSLEKEMNAPDRKRKKKGKKWNPYSNYTHKNRDKTVGKIGYEEKTRTFLQDWSYLYKKVKIKMRVTK